MDANEILDDWIYNWIAPLGRIALQISIKTMDQLMTLHWSKYVLLGPLIFFRKLYKIVIFLLVLHSYQEPVRVCQCLFCQVLFTFDLKLQGFWNIRDHDVNQLANAKHNMLWKRNVESYTVIVYAKLLNFSDQLWKLVL